jgi:hypothetical protein
MKDLACVIGEADYRNILNSRCGNLSQYQILRSFQLRSPSATFSERVV